MVARLVVAGLLCGAHGLQFLSGSMTALTSPSPLPTLTLVTSFLQTLSDIIVIVILLLAKRKGFFRSGVVWTYVLMSTLSSLLNFYLLASSNDRMSAELMTEVFCLPVLVILLFLCSFSDASAEQKKSRHPQEAASFPSAITFHWCGRLAFKALRQTISMQDLHILPVKFTSDYVDNALHTQLTRMAEKKGRIGVRMALFRAFFKELMLSAFLRLCKDLLNLTKPVLLRLLIISVTAAGSPLWYRLALCLLLFGTSLLSNVCYVVSITAGSYIGLMARSAVTTNTYRKALNMNIARSGFTVGDIVNLMSVDTDQFRLLSTILNDLWAAPLTMLLGSLLLYSQLGVAAFASMTVLLMSLPLNAIASRFMKEEQSRKMKHTDERTSIMSEILTGMKAIKLYAWEGEFTSIVQQIRNQEARHIIRAVCYNALVMFIVNITNVFVLLATFATYVLLEGEDALDPTQVFFIMTILSLIRTPLLDAASALPLLMNVSVSSARLDRFFASPDKEDYVQRTEDDEYAVRMEDAVLDWSCGDEKEFQLRVQDLKVKEGSLAAIVGSVGSGKSSLISALLGEMQIRSGNVAVKAGRIAFVPQQAWIMNKTVRDNILFYKDFDKIKYWNVIRKCKLEPDLAILAAGDETEIGEKGINLSGGQKQRVSIARACFSDADIFLFDDPLSAVDAHVSKSLFDNVLSSKTGMLRGQTRILVTNNLSVLPHVDTIFVMKEGAISEAGSYEQLMSASGEFKTLIQDFGNQQANESEPANTESNYPQRERRASVRSSRISSRKQSLVEDDFEMEESDSRDGTLTKIEAVETGTVKFGVFITYFHYFSFLMYIIVFGFVFSQVFEMISNYWLSQWSKEAKSTITIANHTVLVSGEDDRLQVYAVLCFMSAFCLLMAMVSMAFATVRAGNHLHNRMLNSVMRCPMLFFETTPIGRILSRFAKDMSSMDREVFFALSMAFSGLVPIIGAFAMIMIAVPILAIALIPLILIVILMQRISSSCLRQFRRLESVSRSILYSHISETLSGNSSIRAYDCCAIFQHEAHKKTDQQALSNRSSCDHMGFRNFRLELISNITVLLTSLFAALSQGSVDESLTGLAITYALMLSSLLNTLLRGISTFETEAVSIERVIEYATQLQPEEQDDQPVTAPPPGWPSDGKIDFLNFSTRYRPELDLVLRDVTMSIKAGEKVGIVGRTGAGKSSITLALFRLIEPTGGRIVIDEMDTRTMALHELRSKLTIIPQDPVLFSGSVRRNLDPAGRHTDNELWSSLRAAGIAEFIRKQDQGLEWLIAEGGENMSVGQRQLMCLSRAVLRKTQILVLDEATAAVDVETDFMIQKTIRHQFADCTVLTIAHRIHTILDSDRVLVLDAGRVVEFDEPQQLLQDKRSIFASLASDALLSDSSQKENMEM